MVKLIHNTEKEKIMKKKKKHFSRDGFSKRVACSEAICICESKTGHRVSVTDEPIWLSGLTQKFQIRLFSLIFLELNPFWYSYSWPGFNLAEWPLTESFSSDLFFFSQSLGSMIFLYSHGLRPKVSDQIFWSML